MPLYKFVCDNCGRIEELLKYDEELEGCPKCGSKNIKRVIGKPKVHYNALGFTKNHNYGGE